MVDPDVRDRRRSARPFDARVWSSTRRRPPRPSCVCATSTSASSTASRGASLAGRELTLVQTVQLDRSRGSGHTARSRPKPNPGRAPRRRDDHDHPTTTGAVRAPTSTATSSSRCPLMGGTVETRLLPGILSRFDVEAAALAARLRERRCVRSTALSGEHASACCSRARARSGRAWVKRGRHVDAWSLVELDRPTSPATTSRTCSCTPTTTR